MAALAHLIGLSAKHRALGNLKIENDEYYATFIGKTIVLQNARDPHAQRILRGHDADVCAIATPMCQNSPYFASGQFGSKSFKDASPILLWDSRTLDTVKTFEGIVGCIVTLSFSPDGKTLLATGPDQLYLWNIEYGEVIISSKLQFQLHDLNWEPIEQTNSRHTTYNFCISYAHTLERWSVSFDLMTNGYRVEKTKMKKGPKGFAKRNYTCIACTEETCYAGTPTGELFIFSLPKLVLKHTMQVCSQGVQSLCIIDDCLIVGGGDKTLQSFQIKGYFLNLLNVAKLNSPIVALHQLETNKNFLALTENCNLINFNSESLEGENVADGELEGVVDVCFFGKSNELIVSLTCGGTISVFDLNNYRLLGRILTKKDALCIHAEENFRVYVGFQDGSFTVYEFDKQSKFIELWKVASAHKAGVTAITVTDTSLVTGGKDGAIRWWSKSSPSFQFQPDSALHTKAVRGIITDVNDPSLFHSCSDDQTIVSYSLKYEKIKDRKLIKNGQFKSISQRSEEFYEIFSAVSDGRTLAWDADYTDPVKVAEDPDHMSLNSVSVSPDGKYILVGGSRCTVHILEFETMKSLDNCIGHSQTIMAVKWTPDGKQFISVGLDSSICVWNWYGPEAVALQTEN